MATEVLPANSAVLERTRELCSAILDLPEYRANMEKIESFLGDEAARELYQNFASLGDEMHQKQRAGTLSESDIDAYDKRREEVESHSLVGPFLTAQEDMNRLHQTISRHVAKTLELGRLPAPEDLESNGGCCGSGGCGSC